MDTNYRSSIKSNERNEGIKTCNKNSSVTNQATSFLKNSATEKDKKQKTEEIVKITVNKEAEEKLMNVMEKVNNGFDSGKVNRQDLASWALNYFASICDAEVIKAIRQDHFDEFAMLEAILKRGKEQGKLPTELRNILRQQMTSDLPSRKSTKKQLTSNSINDAIVDNESDATTT